MRTKIVKFLLYIVMAAIGFVFIFPFVMLFSGSFIKSEVFIPKPMFWWPSDPSLYNYMTSLHNSMVVRWFLNSLLISVTPVITTVFLCALLGYIFAKKTFRGKQIIFWIFMSTMMIPSELTLIPRYIMYDWFGWIDTFWPFLIPGIWSVMLMFLMRQFMKTLPDALIDAANIDGCGDWKTFFVIILPLCQPAMATVTIFTFMHRWNDFMNPLIFVSSESMYNMVVGLATMVQQNGGFGLKMAAGVINFLPMLIIFLFFQKYFTEGIARSGIKG